MILPFPSENIVRIRLLAAFTHHHLSIPANSTLDFDDRQLAERLVELGVAEFLEPRHAVLYPQETRAAVTFVEEADESNEPEIKRPRGRPRKLQASDDENVQAGPSQ